MASTQPTIALESLAYSHFQQWVSLQLWPMELLGPYSPVMPAISSDLQDMCISDVRRAQLGRAQSGELWNGSRGHWLLVRLLGSNMSPLGALRWTPFTQKFCLLALHVLYSLIN